VTTLFNTTQAIDLLAGYRTTSGAQTTGVTIMRTHLELSAAGFTGTGTSTSAVVLGLYIDDQSETAATIDTGPYSDWMLYKYLFLRTDATAGFADPTNDNKVDIRSKRKCHQLNQTLWLMLRPNAPFGYTAMSFSIHARTLLALP
jgi:hypothetical protein